jgi:hypothetical protein
MLLNKVVPRLRAAAPSVPKVGAEDNEEIVADMTANAATMIDSAEKAGRKFGPGNIAWYASRAARSGRRSTGSSRTDVLAAGTQLDGLVHHEHLDGGPDEPSHASELGDNADGLYDIAWNGQATDPAEDAARNLDWEAFLARHSDRHRIAVLVLAQGGTMREASRLIGISDSAACTLRKQVAADLVAFFGEEILRRLLGGVSPGWSCNVRAGRERHLCHARRNVERRAA